MKAVQHTQYGGPEVLAIAEVDKPIPEAGQLLIEVYAASVNRTDCAILSAQPFIMRFFTGLLRPRLSITGTDFAGVVKEAGANTHRFKAGDRVFGFNDRGLSSHAEYVCIPESKAIALIPGGFTFPQAASSLEAAHYAYYFIHKIKISRGQKVLVNGATGGIGSALVQFMKYYGAHITATCRAEHFDLVRALGADELIDYTTTDFTLENKNYDFILDAVGKSSYGLCKRLLNPNGVYISSEAGPFAQNIFLAMLRPLTGNKKVIFPAPGSIRESLDFIQGLIGEGKFRPLIDREYTLEQIKEAFCYVASGQKLGNVLIRINAE